MKCLALENIEFLKSIKPLCNKKKQNLFKTKIKNAKKNEINSISELSNNVLNGNIKCSNYKQKILKPHATSIRFLANKKNSLKSRRNNIRTLRGGWLLGAILPAAISALGGMLLK